MRAIQERGCNVNIKMLYLIMPVLMDRYEGKENMKILLENGINVD